MPHSNILANTIHIGLNVFIHETAIIRGVQGNANNVFIGDNTFIGADVQIICDDFSIGDYGKIHHHTIIHGSQPCKIGHNAWIGAYSLLDATGSLTIHNNCGIGSHSQLWSHIKFGDTLEGCQFNQQKPLILQDDVWMVGHCIVSPITAHSKSMALAGSVITHNMEENCIYAGSPASKITSKLGHQFVANSIDEKLAIMNQYLQQFGHADNLIKIITDDTQIMDDTASYFNVCNRKYTKKATAHEIEFMKFLLPEKAKFIPY